MESLVLDVYDLFHCAVSKMESAHQLWRAQQYEKFIMALQDSASYLAKSLYSARTDTTFIDEESIEVLVSKLKNDEDSSYDHYKSILDVLSLKSPNKIDGDDIGEIGRIFQQYQYLLVTARKKLVQDLKYNEKIKSNIRKIFYSKAGLKNLSLVLFALTILIALPVSVYHHIKPLGSFDLHGQIFWKEKAKVPFTPQNSKHFEVIAGSNQSHEYTIKLDKPVNIYLLRLDPVNQKGLTEIEVEWIRLLNTEDEVLRELKFNNTMYWSCDNCIKKDSVTDSYIIQPTSNDPYMTSSVIDQAMVKKLNIKLRAVSEKTFWEWALGIDKNMEF